MVHPRPPSTAPSSSPPGPHEVDAAHAVRAARTTASSSATPRADPATRTPPRNEAHAVKALKWLAEQRRCGYVDDVLVLANHPLRLGIDSPHEMRGWRDAAPGIMIGMEGAPGAQGGRDPRLAPDRPASAAST